MDEIAVVASNRFQIITELHLGRGIFNERTKAQRCHDYPLGQHIRGAFGYLLMDMGSKLADTYLADKHHLIYFRDARPYHYKDTGLLTPIIFNHRFINYKCTQCNAIEKFPTPKTVISKIKLSREKCCVSQMFRLEVVSKKVTFDFKVIFNLKEGDKYLPDFIGALEFAKDNGLNLGKRSYKGLGEIHFLDEFKYKVITREDLAKRANYLSNKATLRIRLLSDAIIKENGWSKNKIDENTFLQSIKKAAKFFYPELRKYKAPSLRLIRQESSRPHKIGFLDKKGQNIRKTLEDAIPRGSVFTYELSSEAPFEFFEAMALSEMCSGIGKRTNFGKGEFVVE